MYKLVAKAKQIGINLSPLQQQQLESYFKLLVEWNEKINLTTIIQKEEVFEKHFFDSMLGQEYVSGKVCDVGSGAGFPGVVLKLVDNKIDLTLMDSLNKRVGFLKELTQSLGLQANCVHTRAEDAGNGQYREVFDVVTARAVAKLSTLCEYCLPLVKVGGVFLAYKSQVEEEIEQSVNALKVLGGKIKHIKHDFLDNGEKRTILVIEKVRATPKAFPRGRGKERSHPL